MWSALAEQLQSCAQVGRSGPCLPEGCALGKPHAHHHFPLQECSLDSVVPFDAASEVPVEEQRAEALVRIRDCLLAAQATQALALLRSAR